MPCRIAVDGELATLRLRLADPQEPTRNLFLELGEGREALEKELGDDLTDDARRLLGSEDVTVVVEVEEGSLLVAAVIAGKVIGEIGAFFAGLREIRALFPKRIREGISEWLGPDLAMRDKFFEMGRGLLRAKEADPEDTDAKDKDGKTDPASLLELAAYALLSLAVLIVVALVVIKGVSELT
jgi:hypothetical protein